MNGFFEKSCIALAEKDLGILTGISKDFRLNPECIVSLLINTVFIEREKNQDHSKHKAQRALRKSINLQCIVKFIGNENEMHYITAKLINISLFGVCIEIDDEYRLKEYIEKDIQNFEINTYTEYEDIPISFSCRACHVHRGTMLRIGGALITPEQQTLKFFLKFMMGFDFPPSSTPQ